MSDNYEKFKAEGGEDWGMTIRCKQLARQYMQFTEWFTELKERRTADVNLHCPNCGVNMIDEVNVK